MYGATSSACTHTGTAGFRSLLGGVSVNLTGFKAIYDGRYVEHGQLYAMNWYCQAENHRIRGTRLVVGFLGSDLSTV
jgi:hypothetical protein